MSTELLQKYADLKKQVSALEEQLEEIKPDVTAYITELVPEGGKIESEFGIFSLIGKRKYTYSPALTSKMESIKQEKKEEEAKGIATYEVENYVQFKSN